MLARQKRAPGRGSWYYRLPFPKKMGLWGVIFLLPWILGFFLFFLTPMIRVFIYSVHQVDIVPSGGLNFLYLGLENFRQALLVNTSFTRMLVETLVETVLFTPLILIFSLLCAILLNGKFFGRSVARAVFFIPIVLGTGLMLDRVTGGSSTLLVEAQEATSVYGAEIVYELLFELGIGTQVLGYIAESVNNIFEIVSLSGIQILIFLSALQSISPSLYEVAKIEGATGYETFCKVTVVMVSPMILTCMIYTLADLFMRSEVMDRIYDVAFRQGNYGLSAAMSTIYLLINLLVIGVAAKMVSKAVFYYD